MNSLFAVSFLGVASSQLWHEDQCPANETVTKLNFEQIGFHSMRHYQTFVTDELQRLDPSNFAFQKEYDPSDYRNKFADLFSEFGLLSCRLGNVEAAGIALNEALLLDPTRDAIHEALGDALLLQQDLYLASEHYTKVNTTKNDHNLLLKRFQLSEFLGHSRDHYIDHFCSIIQVMLKTIESTFPLNTLCDKLTKMLKPSQFQLPSKQFPVILEQDIIIDTALSRYLLRPWLQHIFLSYKERKRNTYIEEMIKVQLPRRSNGLLLLETDTLVTLFSSLIRNSLVATFNLDLVFRDASVIYFTGIEHQTWKERKQEGTVGLLVPFFERNCSLETMEATVHANNKKGESYSLSRSKTLLFNTQDVTVELSIHNCDSYWLWMKWSDPSSAECPL